jgi:3-oxoacyl-[acyl-carrier protein] reductase
MVAKQGITRIGEVEDIANVVAFLLGPQADYMQGSVVDVDGGRTKGV